METRLRRRQAGCKLKWIHVDAHKLLITAVNIFLHFFKYSDFNIKYF